MPIHPSIHLSVCLSACVSISLSLCELVNLFVSTHRCSNTIRNCACSRKLYIEQYYCCVPIYFSRIGNIHYSLNTDEMCTRRSPRFYHFSFWCRDVVSRYFVFFLLQPCTNDSTTYTELITQRASEVCSAFVANQVLNSAEYDGTGTKRGITGVYQTKITKHNGLAKKERKRTLNCKFGICSPATGSVFTNVKSEL